MKKKTAQQTLRYELHNFADLQMVAQYKDIATAELARYYVLKGLYEDMAQMEVNAMQDDARGTQMLRGMQVIKSQRGKKAGEFVCA